MKLQIEQNPENAEVEITIRCGMMDERLAALVQQIQLYAFSLPASKDGRQYNLALQEVFYFESVEEKTFAYSAADVYQCEARLYELEEKLAATSFVRVGKSVILNTLAVESVRPTMGGRLEALLGNGEKVLVNRHYVPDFKKKFGLGGE